MSFYCFRSPMVGSYTDTDEVMFVERATAPTILTQATIRFWRLSVEGRLKHILSRRCCEYCSSILAFFVVAWRLAFYFDIVFFPYLTSFVSVFCPSLDSCSLFHILFRPNPCL